MTSVVDQVLAAIPFAQATTIVVTAGLALIALSFLGFVLRTGINAANGNVGTDDKDSDDDDDDKDDR